jgi:hypothetical protein
MYLFWLQRESSVAIQVQTPGRRHSNVVTMLLSFLARGSDLGQVFISFQRPSVTVSTVNQYKDMLRDDLFEIALNRRLYRLSRQEDPPFYSAQVCRNRPVLAVSPLPRSLPLSIPRSLPISLPEQLSRVENQSGNDSER